MPIGAGQIVAANGYDLSGDVTQFDTRVLPRPSSTARPFWTGGDVERRRA